MAKRKKVNGELPERLKDQNGDLVPVKYIPEHDLKRHLMVSTLIKEAKEIETNLAAFKQKVVQKTDDFIVSMMEQSGIDPDKFKGNITLYNFDKSCQVEINTHEFITFNEKIGVARELISQCLEEWTKGSKRELSLLVSKAFKTDKRGFLDTKRILDLLSYDIEDERWKKAMDIIRESISVSKRKKYYSFRTRNDKGDFEKTVLDFSGASFKSSDEGGES